MTPVRADNPEPPEPRRKTRKTPGDPAHCDRCLWSKSGACPDHLNFYAAYDPLKSIPPMSRQARDDSGHWRAVM